MVKYRRISYFISRGIQSGLFYVPFLLFIILLSLSFFAGPAAEDLAIYYYDNVLGVKKYISQFYHDNCSRYFSFPVVFMLFNGKYLLEHYYLIALGLFTALWGVLFLFVRVVTGALLVERISRKWCMWLSMVLLLAICSIMFEMASVFYWISGSMNYLLSFILFVLLAIILLAVAGKSKLNPAILFYTVLLAIVTAGTNEITLFFLILSLLWFQSVHYSISGRPGRLVNLLLLVVLVCFIFLIIPGGASHRAGNFKLNFSPTKGILVSIGYTGRNFFQVLSSPMVWLCMVLAGFAGSLTKESIRSRLAGSFFFNPLVLLLCIFLGVSVFYFLIYIFSGELLPPRANDLFLFYIFFFLLIVCFAYAVRSGKRDAFIHDLCRQDAGKLFVFLIFITSPLFYRGIQNVVVGFIYKEVMEKREQEITVARQKGVHKVVLHPYEEDFGVVSGKILPLSLRVEFSRRVDKYPGFIFYQDPLADTGLYIHYYAEYHHIDTIHYLGLDYMRIGLMENGRKK